MFDEGVMVIDCHDELTIANVAEMYGQVLSHLAEGNLIQFDTSKIEYIDIAAIQMIYAYSQYAVQQGHILHWQSASDAFVHNVELLGMSKPMKMINVSRTMLNQTEGLTNDQPTSDLDSTSDVAISNDGWEIDFWPHRDSLHKADDPIGIFNELNSLGDLSVEMDDKELPDFADLEPEDSYLKWTLTLRGNVAELDVIKSFKSIKDDSDLVITPLKNNAKESTSPDEHMIQQSEPESEPQNIISEAEQQASIYGQTISVGEENYIIPSVSIIDTLAIKTRDLKRVLGKGELYQFADEYLPIIRLHNVFNLMPKSTELEQGLLMIVESEDQKMAIFIDDLLEQQSIEIERLDKNYRKLLGISGATILADSSLRLVLDIAEVMALYRDPSLGKMKLHDDRVV
jgi:chemotaxis protein histidine kinase CheA